MSLIGIVFVVLALVAVLVLGGVAGDLVARDPGYVLITYDGMAIETSLWIAVAGVLLGLFSLWLIAFLLTRLLRSWGMLGRWTSRRRQEAAASRTTQGLLLMAEGQWAQAQRALVAAAPNSQAPMVNYLTAARAAAAQDLGEARDALLVQARESTPGSALAVGLVQAELQQQAGEWPASLTLLNEMRDASPRHPGVQRLYLKTLQHLGRHQDMLGALAGAKKSKAVSKADLAELEAGAYAGQIAASADLASFRDALQAVPKSVRVTPTVATSLGQRAVALQQSAAQVADTSADADAQLKELAELVEPSLRAAIDKVGVGAGSERLLTLYGQLQGEDRERQQALQRWHKKMPQHAAVLLAAAQVAVQQEDLVGAREQLEQALALPQDASGLVASGHLQMAQLCCAQGDAEGALAQMAQVALVEGEPGLLALRGKDKVEPAAEADSDDAAPAEDASAA